MSFFSEIKDALKKIREVFTKEYKKEIEYREFMAKNIDIFKLKSGNFDVDERIDLLRVRNFKSNFQMSLDDKNETDSVFHSEEQEKQFSKIANEHMNPKTRLEDDENEENDNQEHFRLNPMMPRRYNATQRKEIRKREAEILKGKKDKDIEK